MNLPKMMVSTCFACLTGLVASSLSAAAPVSLQALSDAELSHINLEQTTLADSAEQRALRHRVYEIEKELQHFSNNGQRLASVDWQPQTNLDDLPNISPALRAHVENIAKGLQSDDPRRGLHIMIEGFESGIQLENLSFDLFGFGMLQSVANLQDKTVVQTVNKSGVTEANRNLLPLAQR